MASTATITCHVLIREFKFVDHLQLGNTARTGDGNIETELSLGSRMGSGMGSVWSAHSGDGQITLRLPPDLKADLDAHTGDGSIHITRG